jgi:hypothetical protein
VLIPAIRISPPPFRAIGWLLAAALLVVTLVDAGSVVLTRVSVPEGVRDAGRAAGATVPDPPLTPDAASAALAAARAQARPRGLTIRRKGFTIYPDGRVTLTGSRTAPTLLLCHLDRLRGLAEVSATETVQPSPY